MNTVITISRQYGSSGRVIGEKLAGMLGVPFYDKQSLKDVAAGMGVEQAIQETYGDKAGSLLYSLAMGAYSFGYHDTSQHALFSQKSSLVAFDAVRKAAAGLCVIVGRCADYALRSKADCVRIFIHAPLEVRIQTVAGRHGISLQEAEEQVCRMDRLRQSYYNYYTNRNWGQIDNYHFSADSSLLGIDGTAGLLYRLSRTMLDGGKKRTDNVVILPDKTPDSACM